MPPRTDEQTSAIFDEWSDGYDADLQTKSMQFGPLAGYTASIEFAGQAVVRQVSGDDRLLDIGIGTGALAGQVILQHPQGATLKVTGIDPSAGMRRRLSASHPTIIVQDGDFLRIPAEDDGWDAIISSFAFHEVAPEQRKVALDHVAAAVRPGGLVALLDIMFASPAALAQAEARADGWDPTETYHFIADLDESLRTAGLTGLHRWQTAPMHWLATGQHGKSQKESIDPSNDAGN